MSEKADVAIPEVGVLALVPEHWSSQWQPRHHVLSRLAQYFNVLWMNPPHYWSQVPEEMFSRRPQPPAGMLPSFKIYQPELWLPRLFRPARLARGTARLRLKHARALLAGMGAQKFVLYLWRPEFADALNLVAHDLSCYHVDDEYSFSETETGLLENEVRLLKAVDQVFIHSPGLLDKKGHLNPTTLFVPNGVDYDAHALPMTEPPDLRSIPHPRVGYTGYLKKQLDWKLIEDLVNRHQSWNFVLVGGQVHHPEVEPILRRLALHKHVHFLGDKSVTELAKYPQHFDACIMPYKKDDYTKYIYPLKLHEYLAGGRPVVGTRIRSLEEHAAVVALADDADSWSEALRRALSPEEDNPARKQQRQAVALQHDWTAVVFRVAQSMARGLGGDFHRKLEQGRPLSRVQLSISAKQAQ